MWKKIQEGKVFEQRQAFIQTKYSYIMNVKKQKSKTAVASESKCFVITWFDVMRMQLAMHSSWI